MWIESVLQGEYIHIESGAAIRFNNQLLMYFAPGDLNRNHPRIIAHFESEDEAQEYMTALFENHKRGELVYHGLRSSN